MPQGIQYDERKRPYILMPDGRRNYISPVAMGEKPPADTTGFFHSRPQWNQNKGEFETPFDWGKMLNIGVGAGLGLGAMDVIFPGLFGAGAAPPYVPGGESGVLPPSLAAENAGHILKPPVPLGGVTPPGGGTTPPGGNNPLGALPDNMPAWLRNLLRAAPLAAMIPMLANRGGPGNGSGNDSGMPDLRRAQAMNEARFRRTDPLHEAVTQLAFGMLPIQAREGINLSRVPLPE